MHEVSPPGRGSARKPRRTCFSKSAYIFRWWSTRILITISSSSLNVLLSRSWNTFSLRCVAILAPCSNSSRIDGSFATSDMVGSSNAAPAPLPFACATLIVHI